MNKQELIKKITSKKEFSQLPKRDVELALEKFDKERNSDHQKLKLTRNFLRNLFSSFSSRKLLQENVLDKGKDLEWLLKKHKSTKERFDFYEEIYRRFFYGIKKVSLIDLGSGINGLSYNFLKKYINEYVGIEAVGQLVNLNNYFFKKNSLKKAITIHQSLFELDSIKEIVNNTEKPRVIFLLKVIDSLESMNRNYSKDLLNELSPLTDRFVLSFATKSLGNRKKFSAQRGWIVKFVEENFRIIEDFELNGERYIVFSKK
ncbi:MAG: hypothetical protein ABH811_00225 [archaeon]